MVDPTYSYMGRRGERGYVYSEEELARNAQYAQKRENLAKLSALKEINDEYRHLKNLLCCCENDNIINAGCVVCGVKSRVLNGRK